MEKFCMKRKKNEYVAGFIKKAAHDLVAAEATLKTEDALDMVCFHSQQAVESGKSTQ